MRVNPVKLAQTMVRTQGAAINPVPKVVAGRSTESSARIESAPSVSVSPALPKKISKKQKSRKRESLNWDGLGGEVDVWV